MTDDVVQKAPTDATLPRTSWLPKATPGALPYVELLLVLGVSLGKSAVYSILSIIEKSTRAKPLSQQTTSINTSVTPDRPWLDFAYQVTDIVFPMVPAVLALYLLYRSYGVAGRLIGYDFRRQGRDWLHALVITAVIGTGGILIYVLATNLGVNTKVNPGSLSDHWWTIPVYLGLAWMNGFLEEVIMVGFVAVRLTEKGWGAVQWIVASAVVRGAYHLYQGFGGFVGNLIMGLLLGWYFHKTKRVMPLVLAHFAIDAVIFIGYPLVKPLWPWLP